MTARFASIGATCSKSAALATKRHTIRSAARGERTEGYPNYLFDDDRAIERKVIRFLTFRNMVCDRQRVDTLDEVAQRHKALKMLL